ncbi:DUF4328 domain-containing protein [Streptomyces sp. DG2A-72]|uniref:DUF4328 domain-containing protein n=1 Tax=Streptomyces sp. DG2A-72 TaxID=3051386 RepID=UPI00265C2D75|nr:DUF4328 domain-containing protein [Streptomyces sp. DG2A-72]MDO0930931.1 DUF4328 domain-containing protein [Streptomyces sp. DG2A-72]
MKDQIARSALRPVRGTALCAVAALVLVGMAWTARAVWQIRLATAGQPSSGPPDQGDGQHRPLTGLEDAYHIVSSLGDAATVVCAIAFITWLWRVRDNAYALSAQRPRYSSPWVYLGWIIPIANLWIPRALVADIHRTGAPEQPLPRVVNWWWALWLVGMVSGVGLMYTDSTDEVIARAYSDVGLLLAADAAMVGAAVAGALMVRALTSAQEDRRAAGVAALQ